jgi:hypothetical protein
VGSMTRAAMNNSAQIKPNATALWYGVLPNNTAIFSMGARKGVSRYTCAANTVIDQNEFFDVVFFSTGSIGAFFLKKMAYERNQLAKFGNVSFVPNHA